MSEPTLPSAAASILAMASVTWKRLLRGRAIIVASVIAVLPVLYAAAMGGIHGMAGEEVFVFEVLSASVLAPMFVAASIGEEIEDRTTSYLWSRPIPRWSIIAGKLVTLVPVATVIICGSWIVAAHTAWHAFPAGRTVGALAAGTLVLSLVSAGIASLAPRHGMALTICYLLFFDSPLGVLPATLAQLSVTHQIRALSGLWSGDTTVTSTALALALLAAFYSGLAALRFRKLEA